jgi:hypothetical protein
MRRLGSQPKCDVAGASWGGPDVAHLGQPMVTERMTASHVRREKAALSSGCKAHPAIRSRRKQSEQSWR